MDIFESRGEKRNSTRWVNYGTRSSREKGGCEFGDRFSQTLLFLGGGAQMSFGRFFAKVKAIGGGFHSRSRGYSG